MIERGVTTNEPAGIADALSTIARRLLPACAGIGGLQRLSGGATQEIWRFDCLHADTSTPMILRRAPGGERMSEAGVGLEVEARLIGAARGRGVPVPPVHTVLEPADGLGRGFIMGFVHGETLGSRIVKSPALAAARVHLAEDCGAILARIHAIDPVEFSDLIVYRPADLIAQWQDAYRRGGSERPVFELALRWLRGCMPAPRAPRLVHGDFRNGNLMIGPDGVRAVLDWELAHIGDPMEDLGWICVNSWRFGRIDKPVGGFGELADLWRGYEKAGGRVDREAALWWEVFGTLRWGAICAGAATAFHGPDPTVERAMIARRTSETEIDLLRLLEA